MPLTYRTGTTADNDCVHSFLLEHFRVLEPITRSIGATEEDVVDFFADLRDSGLQNGTYSTLVFDEKELVAVCLNSVKELSANESNDIGKLDPHRDYAKDIAAGPYRQQNANRLVCFVDAVEEGIGCLVGGAERIFKIDLMCVREDKQGMGIARSLVDRALSSARDAGCPWVATAATAVASQALFTKCGFGTLRELPFSCFREDGVPVYRNLQDGGRCGRLMAMRLEIDEDEDDLK